MCAISLLASSEGKQSISFATDMITIPRICGVSLKKVIRFAVSDLVAKRDDMVSTLDLYLSGLSAKCKYHAGNCSNHEEICVIVHEYNAQRRSIEQLNPEQVCCG